ncbi:hypothetical protein [Desemzia sp. FAM 24101]|uniref:hypothetical protein n=1 Tax=Desemzia sp. FAM 24101 TaxID=3259522 RepID=UPI003884ACFE
MSEYQSMLSLYGKHKRYEWKVILFSLVMLGAASLFVALDVMRVNPFVIYLFAMGATLYFAFRIQVVSKNYSRLERMVKEYDLEMYQNKELLFFIDYHVAHSAEWPEILKEPKASPAFEKMLAEMKSYYTYIKAGNDNELSLTEYQGLLESSK